MVNEHKDMSNDALFDLGGKSMLMAGRDPL